MSDPLGAAWNRPPADERPPPSPDGGELADLIDFGPMNQLLREFLDVVGLPVAIIDLTGRVLAASPWQRICMDFHRANPRALERCLQSDITLAREMAVGKDYALYRCQNGLTDCAVPIVVENRHMANLFIGQFFVSPPDEEFFRRQARELGFPQDDYMKALAEVPIVDEGRLPTILSFLNGFARLIASQSLAERRAVAAQRDVERQVAERTAELAAVNRELEAFAYSVSHDLRAPLNAIEGFARLIDTRYAERMPQEARDLFRFVLDNAARMSKLITDLLAFSRTSQSEMTITPVDMNALVREVIEELRHTFADRMVVFDVGELPPADGDMAMLHQVVTNLLSNAIKFTASRPEATIAVDARREGDGVVYRVRDNGVGFDMKFADQLFKVFRRLHAQSQYDGTGVGLALVKRIVERHGGSVGVASAPDAGTTVSFTLPVSAPTGA
jgi:signal transduction histidine kinase